MKVCNVGVAARRAGAAHCQARTASGATGVVMRLEKRCHQSATERLAKLGALRRQPFVVAAGTIFGANGAATLSLDNAALTDASIEVLACACAAGALPQVTVLLLSWNQIGDVGMQAFSTALAGGALALGAHIFLMDNNLTDAGKQAARDATSDSGRKVYL